MCEYQQNTCTSVNMHSGKMDALTSGNVQHAPKSLCCFTVIKTELGGTVGEKAALFTDTLLRSAEEVMPGQIRQSRISGLLEDEAMHDEFEEAWTEREEARKAVHGTLTDGSAFRALRKACKKLREVIQAAEDRYLEVFACELEEFIVAGDLRGWYGHLKGGWKLQGVRN